MTDIVDTTQTDTTAEPAEQPGTTRRSLMSKAAIAAAVGAAAGIAMDQSASAADGGNFILGQDNVASANTRIAGRSTLYVINGASQGSASIYGLGQGTTGNKYGVRGEYEQPTGVDEPTDPTAGVYGDADGKGDGVRGVATGDGAGVYGVNDSTDGVGVQGTSGAEGGRGVYGESTGSAGSGVYGEHKGEGTRSGAGVRGISDGGAGVVAAGSTSDLLANGSGKVQLGAVPTAPPSASASGTVGQIARDDDGSLWYCYGNDTWRKIAGEETSGAFHAVTPFRCFDSRFGSNFTAPSDRSISVKDSIDVTSGAISAMDQVPADATAVTANVTVTETTGRGFVAANPGGVTAVTASTVNWTSSGVNLANAGTFKLGGDRSLQLVVGGRPGSNVDVFVDITGYYL